MYQKPCGVNLDQCVYATLIDAACLGYDCVLVQDCAATSSPSHCIDKTIYNVCQCFGFVTTSGDFLDALRTSRDDPLPEPKNSRP